MRRRTRFNDISASLVDYLVTKRNLSQNDIADILKVDKSFISRVRGAEREFSPTQIAMIADKLGVPMGAMLIDSAPMKNASSSPEKQQIVDLCDKLMRQADEAVAALRAKSQS